jgi:prevent-host-death family protein
MGAEEATTMRSVGIRELKEHTTEILTRVRDEGQPIDITYRGEVIARIVPVGRTEAARERTRVALAELKQLAAEIGARQLPPTDARAIMDEQRREL